MPAKNTDVKFDKRTHRLIFDATTGKQRANLKRRLRQGYIIFGMEAATDSITVQRGTSWRCLTKSGNDIAP